MKFETIYRSNGAYHGVSYRATSNGKIVHLQASEDLSRPWRTREKITIEQWEKYAEELDIYNPYNDNPAHIYSILGDLWRDN